MLKKILFYCFIITSIAGAAYGYYFLSKNKEPKVSVTEHISKDVNLLIETTNFNDLLTKACRTNLIWNELIKNEDIAKIQTGVLYFDSITSVNPEIKELINDNRIYWSIYKNNKNTEQLIQFKLKEQTQEALVNTFLQLHFTKNNLLASLDVYDLSICKKPWYVIQKNGIVYFSSDISLLEKSVTLTKNNSIANYLPYTSLIEANGAQPHKIFINHVTTKVIDANLFSAQSQANIDFQIDQISLNGFLNHDSISYYNALINQETTVNNQFEHLPNNPVYLSGISISNPLLFYKNLLQHQLVKQNTKDAWLQLNDLAMYDLLQETLENTNNEIVTAKYHNDTLNYSITSFKIVDPKKADELLRFMADSSYTLGSLKIYRIKPDFKTSFAFYYLSDNTNYACFYDNGLYLFSSQKGANIFEQSIINANTLGKNSAFMYYANDNFTHASNFFYFENVDLIKKNNLSSIFNITELLQSDKAISSIALTANNYKNLVQYRLNLSQAQQKATIKNSAGNLWEAFADTTITSPIFEFKNHLTSQKELCFQDETKQLYLVNSTGNIIWKKQLLENIQSKIYTVDVFKNNKFQLLFNTENYIHLIDRNGNEVQGYPIKMPASVTSNITLLDYENTKDYRIFIACADNKIYNYNLYGIKTEGFAPYKTVNHVTLPIHYVKVGPSDYLIAIDTEGKIYVFSRKGEPRIELKNKAIVSLTSMHVLGGNSLSNTKLIYLDDKNNLLNKISLSDNKETVKFGDELTNFKTSYCLINDDAQTDLLIYGDGGIFAYDIFSNKLLEYFQSSAYYAFAQLANTSKNDFIVAYDKVGQKTDLITLDGKLKFSSPSTNNPLISNLYQNEKTYLISIVNNKIVCNELK